MLNRVVSVAKEDWLLWSFGKMRQCGGEIDGRATQAGIGTLSQTLHRLEVQLLELVHDRLKPLSAEPVSYLLALYTTDKSTCQDRKQPAGLFSLAFIS